MHKRAILLTFFAIVSTNLLFSQGEIDKTWDGGAGTNAWEDGDNWDPDGVPGSNDDVHIDGAYTVTISSNRTIESLLLENDADLTIQANDTLTVDGDGGDGIEVFDAGTTLTIQGRLNTINHGGNGIDINENSSLTVTSTGSLMVSNAGGDGIETSDNITNSGSISISDFGKVGIEAKGNIAGRTISNSGDLTISSGGIYGLNQKNNWVLSNTGTVTLSGCDTLIDSGSNFNNIGTLKGDGIIQNGNGNDLVLIAGSTLAPGTSIGKITFEQELDLTNTNLDIEIDGATDFDQVVVNTGSVTLGNANLILSGTFVPSGGEDFKIIDKISAGAMTGTFNGLPEGSTVTLNGVDLTISYSGGDGNDIVFTAVTPLPVELIDFNAQAMEEEVKLAWTTASEINNDFFTIERSVDGRSFNEIAIISGNGNTTEISKYVYMDKSPERGLNYYRLKQTDFDGQFSYSDLKTVNFESDGKIKIYPTIVNDVIIIETGGKSDGDLSVVVRDLMGKEFKSFNLSTDENTIELILNDLIPGSYFITINNNKVLQTFKILKL